MIDAVKSSDTRPVVSFCIPVYNNAAIALDTVKGLLVSDDPRFEVVVNDNASTDDMQEVLSSIHDPRFHFYRNDTNLGAHKNWERTLELGRGTYLYLNMMRDRIFGESVTNLIEILETAHKDNVTLLQDGYDTKHKYKVYDGIDAMIRFVKVDHPTATIFDGGIFHSIPDRARYFEISDMYPENYVKRDCLLKGKGASIFSGVHKIRGLFYNSKNSHSTVECSKPLFDMYYAPRRCKNHHFELFDMIEGDLPGVFSEEDLTKYFTARFYSLLMCVSIGWHSSSNYGSKYHGQPPRHVTKTEMLMNILDAYRSTEAHLREKGFLTPAKQEAMDRCTLQAMKKALLYIPVRGFAKSILEPIGIWEILRRLKAAF